MSELQKRKNFNNKKNRTKKSFLFFHADYFCYNFFRCQIWFHFYSVTLSLSLFLSYILFSHTRFLYSSRSIYRYFLSLFLSHSLAFFIVTLFIASTHLVFLISLSISLFPSLSLSHISLSRSLSFFLSLSL